MVLSTNFLLYRDTTGRRSLHFIEELSNRGVDMDKAKISKAEVVLWGFEKIAQAKQVKRKVVKRSKDKIEAITATTDADAGGESILTTWKREILEGRRKERVPSDRRTSVQSESAEASSQPEHARNISTEERGSLMRS
ncbi:hypothetical protein BJ138DRAFT_52158 [Hygrophoropsis aurantiaca]|uniref:Uncharacterized protein n=1 Tax=Hygrophoropsis aurantiaca TaxID=72124 RepID=A0ACB8ACQ8_9AGAM|nr:hypothetical protein BJ138DRAFT_52158 [Hygrophoropsis aurantiaca]